MLFLVLSHSACGHPFFQAVCDSGSRCVGEHGGVGVGVWEKRLVGLLKTPPTHTHSIAVSRSLRRRGHTLSWRKAARITLFSSVVLKAFHAALAAGQRFLSQWFQALSKNCSLTPLIFVYAVVFPQKLLDFRWPAWQTLTSSFNTSSDVTSMWVLP